jgi:TolA-binding protein
LRLVIAVFLLSCACATAPVRDEAPLAELRVELAAQAAQIALQQRRIDELEVRLAAVAARADAKPAPQQTAAAAKPKDAAAPAKDPRPQLKTVKLSPRRLRRDYNPVERAPSIPATIALREPDLDSLASLDGPLEGPIVRFEVAADYAFARAVHKLNDGDLVSAEVDLLAFAGQHPRHSAADNALYLAGLIRENRGDCENALPLFERVPRDYPAGDAVVPALLEKGRCLRFLERADEARTTLSLLLNEHPRAVEVATALQLLQSLDDSQSGRH